MKKIFIFLIVFHSSLDTPAQTEKFDIASFTAPLGWQRIEANGNLSFLDTATVNGLTSFCQITLYPCIESTRSANNNFKTAWQNLVTIPTKSKIKPVTQTDNTPDGWTLTTGTANISSGGLTYKTIVASITGFGKTMNVQVNTAGGNYAGSIEKFFNDLNLDSKGVVSSGNTNLNKNKNSENLNGNFSINDYEFVAPDKWQLQKNKEYISMINPQSGCTIKVLAPQPSSGNLEQDAEAVFNTMYSGWNYQNSGNKKFTLVTGFLPKGHEFFMKEASMSGYIAGGQYNLEEGSAIVVKTGNKIVIISVRHNSSMMGHDDCYRNYNTWARFFNTFGVRQFFQPESAEEDIPKRIIGLWNINATGVVAGEYVFAANGHYQFGGAIGTSTTTSDLYYKYIYNTAYSFEGDGTYSISGHVLTLNKSGSAAEQIPIRFEKVNFGGTGWTDRMWMLKTDSIGKNQVCYDKSKKD